MARSKKVTGDICRHMKNRVPKNGTALIYYFIIELTFLIHYIF